MTRTRRTRFSASLAAIAAAIVIVPSAAAAANITITAPGSINHNKSYTVMVSGQTGKGAYAILLFQHFGCKSNFAADQEANARRKDGFILIYKKVGKGPFDAERSKLKGGVKGSVTYCAYLYGKRQPMGAKPLAHDSAKVTFT